MVGLTDGVEPRCKVKLSWSTQNSDETGSSHPLYRRMVVPCLCDSATLSVSWWCTSRVRMATGFMYACTYYRRALRTKSDMHAVPDKTRETVVLWNNRLLGSRELLNLKDGEGTSAESSKN